MLKSKSGDKFQEMTQRPIPGLIISLGIPTTITMLITNVYNLADTFFVSKLGASASGAIGIVYALMAVLQAVGFLLGQGAGSNISRKLGARDVKSASTYASIGFFSAIILGIIIAIIGIIGIDPFMRLLGSTDTILPYSKVYGTYILLAAPAMLSCFVLNNILRFEGKAAFGMIGVTLGGILNIIGDPIFMFGLDMGVAGAGLSTALSQYISFVVLLSMFLRGKTQSKLSIKNITNVLDNGSSIIKNGFPSLVRQGLGSVATMLLNQSAAVYGDTAIAAMSIVSRVSMFLFCVGLGIGQGFQPVAGFNYGAGKYSRVKKGFYFTLGAGTILLGAFALAGLFASGHIIGLFCPEKDVVMIGTKALRYQCIALFVIPLSVCGNMLFQSIGKSGYASLLSALRSGLFFIPLILTLPRLLGITGIQIAQPIADVASSVVTILLVIPFFKKLPMDVESPEE